MAVVLKPRDGHGDMAMYAAVQVKVVVEHITAQKG